MLRPSDSVLVALLSEALASPFGIAVETSDPESLRAFLYSARTTAKSAGQSAFDNLSFRASANPHELLIVRKEPHNGPSE